ncbi:NERD domain-containing protein [Bacillus shivajii]|uniref:nuclease-related domain-containing protein n=1 Tax=Bacillus shivajii TaxID=1983719 RepID=UPI001CFA9FD2|nr:nuclease-related domain-containing protein [Bacillus shivajii]UCZ52962.1 NERD domain-containing protein [Bacillus shivajii]
MIVKPPSLPLEIRRLEAILSRLDRAHLQWEDLNQMYQRKLAGFRGEISLDYYLRSLPNDNLILHDLKLPLNGRHFQIDILLLNPRYAMIYEVKNITGDLYFEHMHYQLIRKLKLEDEPEKTEVFQCPINQVKNLQWQLSEFFRSYNIDFPLPICGKVVLTNRNAAIKSDQDDKTVNDFVTRSWNILYQLRTLDKSYSRKTPVGDLHNIASHLIKEHDPWLSDFEQTPVPLDDLSIGIRCLKCGYLPLSRDYGTFYCQKCNKKSKDVYEETLVDFGLLKSTSITKREFKDFADLHCDSLASRSLRRLNLPFQGTFKNRKYDLKQFIIEKAKNWSRKRLF